MSSSSIFKSLQELFPQVDVRILRAISIEHEEDINDAVEFILSEVLPAASTKPDFLHALHDAGNPEQDSGKRINEQENIAITDDEPLSPSGIPLYIGGAENSGLHSVVEDGAKEDGLWKPHHIFLDSNSITEPEHEASGYNNGSRLNLNLLNEKENESLLYKEQNQSDHFESPSDEWSEKIIFTEHHTKFSEIECEDKALHADFEEVFDVRDEENISAQLDDQTVLTTVYENCEHQIVSGSEKERDINIQLNGCNEVSGSSSSAYRPLNLYEHDSVVYDPPSITSMFSMSGNGKKYQVFGDSKTETFKDAVDCEKLESFNLVANSFEVSSCASLNVRSCHTVSMDFLEDSIEDAKNSKKSLFSSLESTVSMMREVEILEEEAKQAKEEVLVAGRHIRSKVDELQQIVKQSKDENDMLSGQVYGERSILATEARELQSRLLRMSEERTKYLSITEEIFRALEARKAAANNEIAAANLKMREKEELAQKALEEQELLRDAVVAEAKKLDQEAMENSMLREFLMDRGQVVDSLQGEIAIICEDILSLKRRVDDRIPLSKSIMSSSSSTNHFPIIEASENRHKTEKTMVSLNIGDGPINVIDDWELCEK